MKRWLVVAALATLGSSLSPSAFAQQPASQPQTSPASPFARWKFRNLGPAEAGGRVTSVVGIPGNPNVYYVGTAGGGVWKTTDGGETWTPIFEHQGTASIGVVALAPSNPSLVWVGTGEANPRNDLIDGAGVYFSPDGGRTWQFKGLADAGQISSIVIDPQNPDRVLVGVLGHAWGPNPTRGVFLTTDGGRNWQKVLYVNDSTGVSDLVMAPGNPKVLFAAMWQFRRYPWKLESGGEGSGIYRSTDGGLTWQKLSRGLPHPPLGRIAVAVAPSNPDHVYALIESREGTLWQSLDLGDSWTLVSDNHALNVRPFYFCRLFVAPNDEHRLYFLSYQLMQSDDGGRTARPIDASVHPDHHAFWQDPTDPDRILQGNDGGVYLSRDGGKTWRFLDRLPIEQLYMAGVGTDTPYTLCGGLQDNSAWCGQGNNWSVVTGGDGEYAVPAPADPNIIYADSQNGAIIRLDRTRRLRWSIRPYLAGVSDAPPAELKYRFNWTSPIAVSPRNANEVYLGGNVLFKSTDGGKTWSVISPDLTRNDKSKQETSGGPIDYDISGAETYDTIISITLAPTDPQVIWVGTDDGLVQLTRDGGKTWTNVTPPDAPAWARVYQIGVSPFDPGTAYVAFDAHMLDDHHAYVYRTRDYGRSWQKIVTGLPDSPVHVVREDPNQRGLLVLGNDLGLYFSTDAGDHWQKLPVDFPTVPVWDLQFAAGRDLVVATHGRGFFVLDNLRPIEEWSAAVEQADFHLFGVNDAILLNREPFGQRRAAGYRAPEAPQGAVIDYYLKQALRPAGGGQGRPAPAGPAFAGARGAFGPRRAAESEQTPVKITIRDSSGRVVATRFGPAEAGLNRFVWDLRYDPPVRLRREAQLRPTGGGGEFGFAGGGPLVAPGTYRVEVSAAGHTESASFTVRPDPNFPADAAAFQAEVAFGLEVRDMLNALNTVINRVDDLQAQMTAFEQAARGEGGSDAVPARYREVLTEGRALAQKLNRFLNSVYNTRVQRNVPEDSIHYLNDLHGKIQALLRGGWIGYGEPPSPQARERLAELRQELEKRLAEFNQLLQTDVAHYNELARQAGAPTLFAGEPVALKPSGSAAER